MRRTLLLMICWLVVTTWSPLRADDAANDFFEKKIRPVLAQHCFECHAADSKKVGGGLLLDRRDSLRAGGESGVAIVPGKPGESLLIKALRYGEDSVKMPPQGKLPAAVIADFEEWIQRGAIDPRIDTKPLKSNESWNETFRQRANWWSLKPVAAPQLPEIKRSNWSGQAIDQFVLAKLEQQGLEPAVPSEPRTWARRVSLVLTGLPPLAADADQFVKHCATTDRATAAANFVDSLLASPHFGERWARHWLDVVRFTETHGNEWNYEVHHAWRYRDYLIRAFNADVPYDQFVREHVAGDLLKPPRWNVADKFNESIIGTGFFRFGEVNHDDCIALTSLGYDILDNQLDTLTKAFQATTVACARCHNHKLDAISMQDYYGLLGVLRNSRLASHCIDSPEVNAEPLHRLFELKSSLRMELATAWLNDAASLSKYLTAAMARRAKLPTAEELSKGLDPQRLEKLVAALAVEKMPLEDVLEPCRQFVATTPDPTQLAAQWHKLAERYAQEDRSRTEFNATRFQTFADFRTAPTTAPSTDWQVGGQAARSQPGTSGDFVLHPEGDKLVRTVLPAGFFTQSLSDKLNATLRSPVLPVGKSHISFRVHGQRSSALRLVSNHCQLNYRNYKALTSPDLQWITFALPAERQELRTYAELMTMFDNPKFPDQLSALGGDGENYKHPWDKAAANPRSYFGVTQSVLHDGGETPRASLTHLQPLFAGNDIDSLATLSTRYADRCESAVKAFADNRATDDDVLWLDGLLRRELLANQLTTTPRLAELAQAYRQVETTLSLPRVVAGMTESGSRLAQPIFARGDCTRPGELAPHRFLEVLSDTKTEFPGTSSGRLELAQQLASASNPLTARVMVNRVWHHLFGTGLVRTVDDFGHAGELPSHPELLDHLAAEFTRDGWSMKRLIRSIVLTKTFELSTQPSSAARELDPTNRLWQHYPARRLEAESIRDALLAVSGRLDRSQFGPSIQPYREKDYADRRLFAGPLDGNGRRSLYIKSNLMERPRFLEAFDLPGGKVTQGRRDVTNVPAQALALLNDPFVIQQADVWAARLVQQSGDTVTSRIDSMLATSLNRSPSPDEQERFEQAVRALSELHQVPTSAVLSNQLIWRDLAHAVFNMQEFIYVP